MIKSWLDDQMRNGVSPAALVAGAVCLLALPSAVLAFSSSIEGRAENSAERAGLGAFTPASVDPRLARQISVASLPKGQVFRFTPAGISTRSDRSVTVAVRVDAATARAITVRKELGPAAPVIASINAPVRIAPTAYNLGVARGYQNFSLAQDLRRINMPDLSTFSPGGGGRDEPSRFNPRLSLDAREKTGRSPRTFEAGGEQSVDVGGSLRVGRNLDVTAGVRYSQERDRLVPLTDGKQDSQAVYVGTQFRF